MDMKLYWIERHGDEDIELHEFDGQHRGASGPRFSKSAEEEIRRYRENLEARLVSIERLYG